MFFVYLQIEMKTVALKISSALMIVWYCFSIIGFDIHTCKGSGETFIATFISGMTCEDIHPEHRCDNGHCCASSIDGDSCCDDDIKILLLTGNRTDDDSRNHGVSHEVYYSYVEPYVPADGVALLDQQVLYLHPDGLSGTSGRLSRLQVWRI